MAVDKDSTGTFIAYFSASFLPWVTGDWGAGIAAIDGKVVDQAKETAFRNALRFMNGLYKEGLLAPNSFTMTSDELKTLLQAEPAIVGTYAAGWKTAYLSTGSLRMLQSFSLKPLAGPQGVRYAAHASSASNATAQWLITDKCKDPELAVALYNYLIDFEVNMNGSVGQKGIVWDYPEAGAKGMDGGPALYRLLVNQSGNKPLNAWWDKGVPVIYPGTWFAGAQTTGVDEAKKYHETGDPSVENYLLQNPDYIELMWNMIAKAHEQYAVPDTYYVPAAILSDDDNIRLSEINASLNTYKTQAYVEFITGVKNIDRDADWNGFIAELDSYGAAEKVSIIQKYYSKK
ncbi:hypothetical protein FACS1894141_5540 [Spirochaetia bacterium]|nr:hypothetical protein FACS1894141_5540 [Spirochaetia bacterium]